MPHLPRCSLMNSSVVEVSRGMKTKTWRLGFNKCRVLDLGVYRLVSVLASVLLGRSVKTGKGLNVGFLGLVLLVCFVFSGMQDSYLYGCFRESSRSGAGSFT